jgi:hypothetical protein
MGGHQERPHVEPASLLRAAHQLSEPVCDVHCSSRYRRDPSLPPLVGAASFDQGRVWSVRGSRASREGVSH